MRRSEDRSARSANDQHYDENDASESAFEGGPHSSLIARAIADGVEDEKCVVAQYRTTLEQKQRFIKVVETNDATKIPIEWVIDIADESNGWFYGTAYHFDDATQMLHVMVPDKQNPSFDGHVPLDHRTVHLIECADGNSEALFNKINRDSVVKVRWEVEWFEEGAGTQHQVPNDTSTPLGRWVPSIARYYIRIANQLLVEDEDFGNDSKGFVMLTADLNLRLKRCQKEKGVEDFNRLVAEGLVQSAPDALQPYREPSRNQNNNNSTDGRSGGGGGGRSAPSTGNAPPVRKILDMSHGLKECLSDLLDERERMSADKVKVAKAFSAFALHGDLDAGLKLLQHVDEINLKERKKKNGDVEHDVMEAAADEAWYLCQRLEKSAHKLLKSGIGESTNNNSNNISTAQLEELEMLRQQKKKLQKELEEKDAQLEAMKSKIRMI